MQIAIKQYPHIQKAASETFAVVAGQKLIIETSPGGAEILDIECPAGKKWSVSAVVDVTETDV